ncbi:MAG TPA: VWA domain-containing protein [Polyangiaceae bacterium]|jgi:Ca-activated chloride channel family protein|nr:VWA domain-containing protein [Polyangiaceae bacterium]
MKIRTVGALAALGMLLTSYSVWSLTEGPRGASATSFGASERHDDRTSSHETVPASFFGDGTLAVDARLGHTTIPAGTSFETFVLVDVRAQNQGNGRPLSRHLAIVVDRSGSMRGKRMTNAIAAAQGAVRRLADGDIVSVVDYANFGHVLVPPTELGSDSRPRVDAQIVGGLRADGDTCISCGLETALDVLRQRPGGVDRVLLVSDGEATTGVRDIAGMRRVADRVRATGATVTTVGVDVDYNERMMTAIAEQTNGRHYFVEAPEALASIFDQELSGLERAVAREAKVELELGPGVEFLDAGGRGFERDGARVSVALGSFSAGEERSVLARVRVPATPAGVQPIATARVHYDDLTTGSPHTTSGELSAFFSLDGARSPLDPNVEERVQRSGAVTTLNEANGLFESGDAEGAKLKVAHKLDEIRDRRRVAVAAAPAPARAALDEKFEREEVALGSAASAFAQPPPAAAPTPAAARESKAAIKRNAASASDLAF